MAVSKIRAAIAGMNVAGNDLSAERFVARRLSAEDAVAVNLRPQGTQYLLNKT